jgi:energy-coupling factor transporter ATP-binding protein EcfA2
MSAPRRGAHELTASPGLPRLLAAVAIGLLGPGYLLGSLAARQLAARRLSWTWTLPALLPAALVALLAGRWAAGHYGAALVALAHARVEITGLFGAGGIVCLVSTPAFALWRRRARLRDDVLHGGQREQAARRAQGPLAMLGTRRAWHQADLDGPVSADGILLGTDDVGRPVRVASPRAHVTIVGATGAGKTTTASVLLAGHAHAGGGLVVVDGKGGHELPHLLRALGERHGRPIALWSPDPYGDPALDALRAAWNPCSDGSPTEVTDRIASSEPQTEPYYKALAHRGLQAATRALHATDQPLALDTLTRLLDTPTRLLELLRGVPDLADEAAWLTGLTDGERSALRGIATRLAVMTTSDPGHWLLPNERSVLLSHAIAQRHLVCFTLPQGAYPELVPHVGRYLLATLNAIAGRFEATGLRADTLVLVDELSAFDGEQLAAGLERGRSAGFRYVLATQSLSNFQTSGGPKLAAAALDNAELVVIHRQADPAAAETLAGIAGTEEAWEHTHKVSGHAPFGADEPGERARRLTARYRAHPDQIKQLRTGEAFLISTRRGHGVRRVLVRAR